MSTRLPLDSRQARIAGSLLGYARPVSLEELAAELRLTSRVIRYNLDPVESALAASGLRLVRRPGVGIWVEGGQTARSSFLADIASSSGPAVINPTDRRNRVLLALLRCAPQSMRSEALEARLGVSRPTVRRDVREAERWLEQHRLHLRRLPGVGIMAVGSEVDVRGGLLALVLEASPTDPPPPSPVMSPDVEATDLPGFVLHLDLPAYRTILADELHDLDDDDPSVITATVSLAIVGLRVREGRNARLGAGRLRSLSDHPMSEGAARIGDAVARTIGVPLARADVASITESLLGLAELSETHARPETVEVRYIERIIAAAAERLHPSLESDDQLRQSLTEHVRRLRVRLRFHLPVSNPLHDEVRKRYPDVYRVATQVLAEVGWVGGGELPVEEVGLLTMYLAGSLERSRLRPKIRVTVVCPAGMATAWILVSRLLAEFPQIEVARVVSKSALDQETDEPLPELVVSTIQLDDLKRPVPSLVVSPLLREKDVRSLSRLLGGVTPT